MDKKRSSGASNDPFAAFLRPPPNETPEEREIRTQREKKEKEVSDAIDREIEKERKAMKNSLKKEVKLLLLGSANSGKSTFLRQIRLLYDQEGISQEKGSYRLVILLSIVQSVRALLSILESTSGSGPKASSSRALDGSSAKQGDADSVLLRRMRLSPVLSLEAGLREKWGVVSGVSAKSFQGRAEYTAFGTAGPFSEHNSKPSWRDSSPILSNVTNQAGPNNEEDDEAVFSNGVKLKSSKSKMRVRPIRLDGPDTYVLPSKWSGKGEGGLRKSKSFSNLRKGNSKEQFTADTNDPVNLLITSKDEIKQLWRDCVEKGLIAGEGPNKESVKGTEMTTSAKYFLDRLDNVCSVHYYPSDEDIVNTRISTIGCEEHVISVDYKDSSFKLRVVDVAGARGQRAVWAQYFSDAEAMIFMVASNEYNTTLPEAPAVNCMDESLDIFFKVCSNPLLASVTCILFLNKVDLLKRKLRTGLYPVSEVFPDYQGANKVEPVLNYFKERFKLMNAGRNRRMYTHFTTSIDIRLSRMTIASINDTIIRSNLTQSGIM
ncbi:G-alpha-domain-containing protein [Atractiella rhizophila]|nr:G-alpha-domain-containing protein [Atractiella rhizophila]